MKRSSLLFVFVFSCWTLIFAQNEENKQRGYGKISLESYQGCKEVRQSEGACTNVIELLQVTQDNDSIAVNIFKQEYKIVNMHYREMEWLLKKNHIDIIQYFTLEENKKYYCQSKIFKPFDFVLLTY
jgi:hypothetical protein